jgi:aminocarboxymuconate-semialdehyde decarboxylase
MPVIDIHTHLACPEWFDLLKNHGGRYDVREIGQGKTAIFADGHAFGLLHPKLFDREGRLAEMDEAGVDISILSLTTPGVIWGGAEVSDHAARISNDCLAEAQDVHPERFRWMATLPMQYPGAALAELQRAVAAGAIGVMVGANVDDVPLTDPQFAEIWAELDRLGLPVVIHPTVPPGAPHMTLNEYHLIAMVGFVVDTTLATARMIFDGFLDRYPNLKLIVPHAGGTLPYLAGRLDNGYRLLPACSENISAPPSSYLARLYYDDALSRADAIGLCKAVCGDGHLMHGSDYPFVEPGRSLGWTSELKGGEKDAILGANAAALFGI